MRELKVNSCAGVWTVGWEGVLVVIIRLETQIHGLKFVAGIIIVVVVVVVAIKKINAQCCLRVAGRLSSAVHANCLADASPERERERDEAVGAVG